MKRRLFILAGGLKIGCSQYMVGMIGRLGFGTQCTRKHCANRTISLSSRFTVRLERCLHLLQLVSEFRYHMIPRILRPLITLMFLSQKNPANDATQPTPNRARSRWLLYKTCSYYCFEAGPFSGAADDISRESPRLFAYLVSADMRSTSCSFSTCNPEIG